MIKTGIIGCGKIADEHALAIRRIPDCEIVGICDTEELMARQFHERFDIKYYFCNVNEFLEITHPDVVHITTPPQSHFELGKICLEAGSNIYVEKPFTLNTAEAEELVRFAEEKHLRITVGHNSLFTNAARRMHELIKKGFLGGPPVHMESHFGYNLDDPVFAKAVLGDEKHWVRGLPGKLLHNLISHGISKIAEHLISNCPEVIACGITSPLLQSIGETEIIDELRVIIKDKGSATAYFTFSSHMRPALNQFRIYGPKNSLILDINHETLITLSGTKYKSYLNQFIPPIIDGKQYITNSYRNIMKFIKRDFHNNSAMHFLIDSFYRSITDDTPLPISYKDILTTSRIMDSIFSQIY